MEILNILVKTNILSNQELRQDALLSNSTIVTFSAGFSSLFSTYYAHHGITRDFGGSVTSFSSALTPLVRINRVSAGNGDDGDPEKDDDGDPDDGDEFEEDEDLGDEEEEMGEDDGSSGDDFGDEDEFDVEAEDKGLAEEGDGADDEDDLGDDDELDEEEGTPEPEEDKDEDDDADEDDLDEEEYGTDWDEDDDDDEHDDNEDELKPLNIASRYEVAQFSPTSHLDTISASRIISGQTENTPRQIGYDIT